MESDKSLHTCQACGYVCSSTSSLKELGELWVCDVCYREAMRQKAARDLGKQKEKEHEREQG